MYTLSADVKQKLKMASVVVGFISAIANVVYIC